MEDNVSGDTPLGTLSPLSDGFDSALADSPMCDEVVVQPDEVITDELLKSRIKGFVKEYFCSQDSQSFVASLKGIITVCGNHCLELSPSVEAVKQLVVTAIDLGERECELASRALSAATGCVLSSMSVTKGIEMVIERIDLIDHPQKNLFVSRFLARAVSDEVIPPRVLKNNSLMFTDSTLVTSHDSTVRSSIVNAAVVMLEGTCVTQKMERVWGASAVDDLPALKLEIRNIVMEFLLNPDMDECARTLLALRQPYFLHEAVKRTVQCGMESSVAGFKLSLDLLVFLHEKRIIPTSQFVIGLLRVAECLRDISLDAPNAYSLFNTLWETIVSHKVISADDQAYILKVKASLEPNFKDTDDSN